MQALYAQISDAAPLQTSVFRPLPPELADFPSQFIPLLVSDPLVEIVIYFDTERSSIENAYDCSTKHGKLFVGVMGTRGGRYRLIVMGRHHVSPLRITAIDIPHPAPADICECVCHQASGASSAVPVYQLPDVVRGPDANICFDQRSSVRFAFLTAIFLKHGRPRYYLGSTNDMILMTDFGQHRCKIFHPCPISWAYVNTISRTPALTAIASESKSKHCGIAPLAMFDTDLFSDTKERQDAMNRIYGEYVHAGWDVQLDQGFAKFHMTRSAINKNIPITAPEPIVCYTTSRKNADDFIAAFGHLPNVYRYAIDEWDSQFFTNNPTIAAEHVYSKSGETKIVL
jgi:hypothetical protein